MTRSRRLLPLALTAGALVLASCGAKTGLKIPDADVDFDAGFDAGTDAGFDAGPMCMPTPLALERRGAQVMFVIDRSNSMDDTIDGQDRDPGDPRPSRWDIVGTSLESVLSGADPLLELGAKFYPSVFGDISTPEEACAVVDGVDVPPNTGRLGRILTVFDDTVPGGGTPTAEALRAVEEFFAARPAPGLPRFVVLATDGGPNCNPDPPVPHTECLCTGRPSDCAVDPTFGPFNCIDDVRTYDVIRRLADDLSIPVFVIGIDDPTRPDLADVLDMMAIAGGRPREDDGGRRFYSVQARDQLDAALTTITDEISRCVFTVEPAPAADGEVVVRIDELLVARDASRREGWDFTAPDRSEISLFGGACARVTATAGEVSAEVLCPPEE